MTHRERFELEQRLREHGFENVDLRTFEREAREDEDETDDEPEFADGLSPMTLRAP